MTIGTILGVLIILFACGTTEHGEFDWRGVVFGAIFVVIFLLMICCSKCVVI